MSLSRTKQLLLILIISFLSGNCSEKKSDVKILNEENIDKVAVEADLTLEKIKTQNISEEVDLFANEPCDEIKEFAAQIEIMNWVSDTSRLRKKNMYQELDRDNVTFFNGKPFYPIKFKNSQLYWASKPPLKNEAFSNLNFDNFQKVKNIWGYFYRDKLNTKMISDGVIEQWEFGNAEDAAIVFKEISGSRGDIIYFNTMPFFCRIDNKLIIFQTRAMAFSYDQKAVFQKFIEKYEPHVWYDNEKVSKKYKANKNAEESR